MKNFGFLARSLAMVLFSILTNTSYAAAFQLFEQNVVSVENFHAGRAALIPDASTAYDNPAGIIRIQNQQVVAGAMGIFTDLKFLGQADTCFLGLCFPTGMNGVVQGGSFSLIPDLHYVAPISPMVGFGLSVVVPYGSDVEWGQTSFINAISERARLQVVDIAPALGFKLTDNLSIGLGADIEKMSAELNSFLLVANSINKGYDTAYGYHLGALYEYKNKGRVGAAYHSKVNHNLRGTSNYIGILADRVSTRLILPPDSTLSIYYRFNPCWAVMGTVVYTQWNVVHNLVLENVAGLGGLPVDYQMYFRNTFTYSIGADYSPVEPLILRFGAGYDQTPTRNAYRILQLPDSDRYVLAIGGHYQFSQTLGIDLGWTRVFFKQAYINPPPLAGIALQQVPVGKVDTSADVAGAQVTWDIL